MAISAALFGANVFLNILSGDKQKEQLERQAERLQDQSEDAIAIGEDRAIRVRREAIQLLGRQRAAYSGQNVDLGSRTATDLQSETLDFIEEDVERVRLNAWRRAMGFSEQAENVLDQKEQVDQNVAANILNTAITYAQYQRGGLSGKGGIWGSKK